MSEDEYSVFQQIEYGELSDSSSLIKKDQEYGYLKPNCVKCIQHPELPFLRYFTQRRIEYMALQVTQNCNLRCKYCAYSGGYEGQRVHSSKRMSWETAKKAIDFFLTHSIDTKDLVFGFYGGEPLLEMELIKKSVSYLERNVQSKKLDFFITTNGTLLTESTYEFLAKHHFHIMISLDGNREEHNKNRVFTATGEGSFDTIINNVKTICRKYENSAECISFNAVMTPQSDLSCMLDFFKTDEILSDNKVIFNDVADGLKGLERDNEAFWNVRLFEYLKYFCSMIGRLDSKYVSVLARRSLSNVIQAYDQMRQRTDLGACMHHNGPCIPGSTKLFVTTDGDFYPCQNANEPMECYRIGSLDNGFDYQKIERLLNIGAITEEECKDCWKLRLCSVCSLYIKSNGLEITKDAKLIECARQERLIMDYLHMLAVMKEFRSDFMLQEVEQ